MNIDTGAATFKSEPWRLQIYWPEITVKEREVFLGLDSCIRIVRDKRQRYYGFGLRVIGFGIGIDYYRASQGKLGG
jgi:hypothetical protein